MYQRFWAGMDTKASQKTIASMYKIDIFDRFPTWANSLVNNNQRAAACAYRDKRMTEERPHTRLMDDSIRLALLCRICQRKIEQSTAP